MKKFLQEFREFAMKGNVIDMAIGVVIGAAFGKVVSSLVDIIIKPIVEAVNRAIMGDAFNPENVTLAGQCINFLGVVIEFILTALVLFLIVKGVNKMRAAKKKPEEAPAAPTTKECPFCLSEVPIKATRCPHCTSELQYTPAKK